MSETLRILVVEDNPADADFIQEVLPETGPVSFQVEVVARLAAALTRLARPGIDLVLLDLGLPDSQGLSTFLKLRLAMPQVSVIVLTGTDDGELATNAVRAGAQDYLVKGKFDRNLLARTAQYAVERQKTMEKLQRYQTVLKVQNDDMGRYQERLAAAQARYFDLYDLAPVGYVTVTEPGVILETNLAAATLLGVVRSELVGQPITRFIPQEDQDTYRRHRQQIFTTGTPQACELRMVTKDGTPFWAQLAGTAAPDAAGAIVCRIVLSNITERKQAEAALRASEERHRTILKTAMDGFWLTDLQGHLLEVNETYSRMSGYSVPELLGKQVLDLEAAETAEATAAHIERIIAQGEDRFESQHRRKDGSVFDVEVSVQYQPADGGRMVAFLRDITERKQAEEALRESEERFRAITLHTPDHIFMQDCDLRYQLVINPQLGLTEADMVGKTDQDFLGSQDAEKLMTTKRKVLATGEPVQLETSLENSKGETEFFEGAYIPKFDSAGKADGLIGYFRNTTERKQAEAALQASLREKVSLLQEIHHRVKNNMQVISSLLRLQSRQVENPIAKTVLLDMINRIGSMALVHEHLYRSENLAEVDLATYLRSLCVKLFRALVVTPGVVQLRLDLAPVRLEIDQAIPCGLLVNELIANALKHAFPAGRTGELRVEFQQLAGGAQLRLRVADDGVGLPANFDMQQLTSLGLQLVADLTRQLGGTLTIGPGPGAAFEVLFQDRRGQPKAE
jgi:PAS domain S-box-containing protein